MTALTLTGTFDRSAVVAATALVADLVALPQVADSWEQESACEGMSVGALTWHLVNQSQRVVQILGAAAPVTAPDLTLDEHYARSAWVSQDLDGPANVGIRTSGESQAEAGAAAAAQAASDALAGLDAVLADPPASALLPWVGWSLSTDDFVATRLMEIVVHGDDLAASVGVPTPGFPQEVLDPVLALLTGLAVRRHGQDALVRTLTRPQRAPGSITAF